MHTYMVMVMSSEVTLAACERNETHTMLLGLLDPYILHNSLSTLSVVP